MSYKFNHTPAICRVCGKKFFSKRRNHLCCSKRCNIKWQNRRTTPLNRRNCALCGKPFPIAFRQGNRKYCSNRCAKRVYNKQQATWRFKNMTKELNAGYRRKYIAKNPDFDSKKNKLGRDLSIAALGGRCIVPGCKVTKHVWLHIDFIPTTVGMKFRHPRHWAYIKNHLHLFRLLCANHHYELTLTGGIEGTDITQPRHIPKRRSA